MQTPINKELIDSLIAQFGIQDFAKATIREVKQVAAFAEKESGVEFIKMEMGIPWTSCRQGRCRSTNESFARRYSQPLSRHSRSS